MKRPDIEKYMREQEADDELFAIAAYIEHLEQRNAALEAVAGAGKRMLRPGNYISEPPSLHIGGDRLVAFSTALANLNAEQSK